jgi:2-polyprenyl-6-hydroxyphenyl methylase/3-demethylubiquinone-9 3-methyltransferase
MILPIPRDDWPDSWRTAHHYDQIEMFGDDGGAVGHSYAYQCRMRKTIAMIERALPKGSAILDIAAAQGNFSLALAERGYRVTWNDLRAELSGYVRLKHEIGDIEYLPGDVFGLTIEKPFDAVLITEIIEHVAHPDEFLAKISQLVRPGGLVFMTTPNGAYFANRLPKFSACADPKIFEAIQFKPDADGHIFLLHPEEVSLIANPSALRIEGIELFTSFFTAGRLKTNLVLRIIPRGAVDALETLSERLPPALARKLLVQMAVQFRREPEMGRLGAI